MRLILTGGGTAGHIFPLISVLNKLKEEIKDERLEVLYIGSKNTIDQEIVKTQNIPSFFIYAGKWRRYWKKWLPALFLNFWDLFLVFVGFLQSLFLVIKFKPDVVMAKGGYVTFPVVLASKLCNIPVVLHESDIVMGLSNKLCAKMAHKICVSFPVEFYKELPKEKLVYTGNPVRPEFLVQRSKEKQLNKKKLPLILVIGGSQGSQMINNLIYQILPQLLSRAEVIHLVGKKGFQEAKKIRERLDAKLKSRYFIYDFIEDGISDVMRRADLILSRAGANVLFEIAALGKPSILIPLKFSASDHQRRNAEVFAKNKAAVLILEEELSPDKLLSTVLDLLLNKLKLQKMGQCAKKLSHPDAASKIVAEILKERQ